MIEDEGGETSETHTQFFQMNSTSIQLYPHHHKEMEEWATSKETEGKATRNDKKFVAQRHNESLKKRRLLMNQDISVR